MEPTLLYTRAFLTANRNNKVKSISHITGGGLIDNPQELLIRLTLKFDMKNFKFLLFLDGCSKKQIYHYLS